MVVAVTLILSSEEDSDIDGVISLLYKEMRNKGQFKRQKGAVPLGHGNGFFIYTYHVHTFP